jgi:hypothetical protein
MSPQPMESAMLIQMIDTHIESLDKTSEAAQTGHGVCKVHSAVAGSMRTLLLCQRAVLVERDEIRSSMAAEAKSRRAETIGIAGTAAAIVVGIIKIFV